MILLAACIICQNRVLMRSLVSILRRGQFTSYEKLCTLESIFLQGKFRSWEKLCLVERFTISAINKFYPHLPCTRAGNNKSILFVKMPKTKQST